MVKLTCKTTLHPRPAHKVSHCNLMWMAKILKPLGSGKKIVSHVSPFFSKVWTGLLLEKAGGKEVFQPQRPQAFIIRLGVWLWGQGSISWTLDTSFKTAACDCYFSDILSTFSTYILIKVHLWFSLYSSVKSGGRKCSISVIDDGELVVTLTKPHTYSKALTHADTMFNSHLN